MFKSLADIFLFIDWSIMQQTLKGEICNRRNILISYMGLNQVFPGTKPTLNRVALKPALTHNSCFDHKDNH